jgi:ribosomal protein S27AE
MDGGKDKMTLTPIAGFSYVEMETLLGANTGPIVLPERLKKIPVFIGRVVKSVFTQRDKQRIGVDNIDGARVILANHIGRHIQGNTYAFPNTYPRDPRAKKKQYDTPYLAIIPSDAEFNLHGIGTAVDEVPRCRFCGPADSTKSQNNVFMQQHKDHGWYCCRCNRTQSGDKIDPLSIEIKEGHTPELYDSE